MQEFGFINGVDNVNWPPYRDLESLYGGQFTLSTPLIKPNSCISFLSFTCENIGVVMVTNRLSQ